MHSLKAATSYFALVFGTGVAIQSQTLGQFIASRDPVSGTVYLLMLGLFALMPTIPVWVQAHRSTSIHEQP